MTAEIVLLNKGAVALAADSAVTITSASSAKVYNTVNKLFTLSKYHPIGIMIYGTAEYMGVPWETIIKLYREHLGRKTLPTVHAYSDDFLRFVVKGFGGGKDDQRRHIGRIWGAYFSSLNQQLRRLLLNDSSKKQLTKTDVAKYFNLLLDHEIKGLSGKRTMSQYRSVSYRALYKKFNTEFAEARDHSFRGRPITPTIERKLQIYAGLLLVKPEFQFGVSGIVIAGFGDKEIFPSVYRAECAGKILGRMKLVAKKTVVISSDPSSDVFIEAFAQGEMVYRFMEGIDESYSQYLRLGIRQLTERLSGQLVAKYAAGSAVAKSKIMKKVNSITMKMVDEFETRARAMRSMYFVRPILSVVSILPKDELAELAGALINITSLKRKISMDTESVGGPIDVAVISKGDGFVWIRRKHYFKPELNPSFLQKYLS